MNKDTEKRVMELAGLLCDELITDEQFDELDRILAEDAEARDLYRGFLGLHQSLEQGALVSEEKQGPAKHRTDTACNSCHQKIDPHGFALENFDPIGRWREAYPNGRSIEADGEIDDRAFDGIDEMKAVLLAKESVVARGLATKLLEYGTGREMGAGDRAEINRLVEELESRGYGMRDLFELVATSAIFLTK